MIKHCLLALATTAAALPAQALTAVDLAFTSFNADEDGFSMVTFTSIGANTQVFFSDNEWNGGAIGAGGAFNTGESYLGWTSGAAAINAGTVIRFSKVDVAGLAASVGTLARVTVAGSSNYGLANSNETLYAYLGSSASAPTGFISAITNSDFSVADGQLAGTGLSKGTTAMRLRTSGSPDYGAYNGVRNGLASFAAYKPLVANVANWTVDTTNGDYAATVPNTTAFSISAVPEPETYALMLAGVFAVGFVAARRRA